MMGARILIIEDNAANMELMAFLLEAYGHTPLQAFDGEQGLTLAKTGAPDLIICDLQLPITSGYEIVRQLKADPNTATIPIVAVTAYAMVGDREKALTAGFDNYISKPINPETFGDDVTKCLAKPLAPKAGSLPIENACQSLTQGSRSVQVLVVDNAPENRQLAHSILEPFGFDVVCTSNVQEGLDVARRHPPDLILSDVHMPGKDGFDFIREVKADKRLRSLPFVFISSTVRGNEDVARGLAAGAEKFIVRPIEPTALLKALEDCLPAAVSR